MCWAVSLSLLPSTFRGDKMTKDDRGDLDLTKQLETQEKELKTLNDVVVNLKILLMVKKLRLQPINLNNQLYMKKLKD